MSEWNITDVGRDDSIIFYQSFYFFVILIILIYNSFGTVFICCMQQFWVCEWLCARVCNICLWYRQTHTRTRAKTRIRIFSSFLNTKLIWHRQSKTRTESICSYVIYRFVYRIHLLWITLSSAVYLHSSLLSRRSFSHLYSFSETVV